MSGTGPSSSSSPIKADARRSNIPAERQNAKEARDELKDLGLPTSLSVKEFQAKYLNHGKSRPRCLSEEPAQGRLSRHKRAIRGLSKGHTEMPLYTGGEPLLRLLNEISRGVAQSLKSDLGDERLALAFHSCHNNSITFPRDKGRKDSKPDVVTIETTLGSLSELLGRARAKDVFQLSEAPSWSQLHSLGEGKDHTNPRHQLGAYTRTFLHVRPDLAGVISFSARPEKYWLMYHDADVMEQSTGCDWKNLSPLIDYVMMLYLRPRRDPSIVPFPPAETKPYWVIWCKGRTYVSYEWRGQIAPGQRRFTAVAVDIESGDTVFIKDCYRDRLRRYFEGDLLDKIHAKGRVPGVVQALFYGFVCDEAGAVFETRSLEDDEDGEPRRREKVRLVTLDVGRPLDEVKSVLELLTIMYDALAAQRNMWWSSKVIHRDISITNLMIAPSNASSNNPVGENEPFVRVPYLNQVETQGAKPAASCLIIDLGNGAHIVDDESRARAERTGTRMFMARSVSAGEVLTTEVGHMIPAPMPTLDGDDLERYVRAVGQYDRYNEAIGSLKKPDRGVTIPPFQQRLFHDAESTFWVLAWLLACSSPSGYSNEESLPTMYKKFVNGMLTHSPSPDAADPRILTPNSTGWERILHPRFAFLADMLAEMAAYLSPDWGHFPEVLDDCPDHVHEALMRLLFRQIASMKREGFDVCFHHAKRPLPPKVERLVDSAPILSHSTVVATSHASSSRSKRKAADIEEAPHERDVVEPPSKRVEPSVVPQDILDKVAKLKPPLADNMRDAYKENGFWIPRQPSNTASA